MQKMFISALIVICLSCSFLSASDHIDGAATIEDGQSDLTDLYAFKTQNKNESLTIILNTYPGVSPEGHFSSKVSYNIFIRTAQINTPPMKPGFKTFVMDELILNCKFKDPGHHTNWGHQDQAEFTCELNQEGLKITSLTGQVGEILENETMRIFAGPRTDSFFISAQTFIGVTNRKKFSTEPKNSGSNAMETINVMSIALELDLKKLGFQDKMLAIGAQSYTESAGVFEALDRVGRPEITNLSLHDFSGKNPIKREYNKLNPFDNASIMPTKFKQRLVDNISAYDKLDENITWENDQLEILADVLIDDFLVINLDPNCLDVGSQYLNIEKEILLGLETKSCGGRKLTDDIMMIMYALYMDGYEADQLQFETGVSVAYQGDSSKRLNSAFPYLDQSDRTTWKQWILFNASKMLQE